MKNNKGFSNLDIKNKIAIITCIISFGLGWSLVCAGFCLPPVGEVADSVLWILGQALLYCASVLGIGMYINGQVKEIRRDLNIQKQDEE